MPEFLLSVWFDEPFAEPDLADPDIVRQMEQTGELVTQMRDAGVWVFHAGLTPATSAKVVRAKGQDVSMIDGPYAETKEQMAGFWIIEAPDLDAALEWAAKSSTACERSVEVRPMQA